MLFLYCPPHEFGSKRYDENFFSWIDRIEMQNDVLLVRDYSADEKMLHCLQAAHFFILNYKDLTVGGGISAAVKTLMRTKRPIIVSESSMFSDLVRGEVLKISA